MCTLSMPTHVAVYMGHITNNAHPCGSKLWVFCCFELGEESGGAMHTHKVVE